MDKPGLMIMIGHAQPPKGDMGMHGHEMCNIIAPSGNTFKDVQDGETVECHVKGKIIEEDGMKMLMVEEVDGDPVQDIAPDDQKEPPPEMNPEEMNKSNDQAKMVLKDKLGKMYSDKPNMYS